MTLLRDTTLGPCARVLPSVLGRVVVTYDEWRDAWGDWCVAVASVEAPEPIDVDWRRLDDDLAAVLRGGSASDAWWEVARVA